MALRGFQERKMFRKVLFSVPVALVLWGMILWMLWSSVLVWNTKIKLSRRNDEIKMEIKNTTESLETIERKMESLKSEYGIDLEARGKFNLTKPGERVAIFGDLQQKNEVLEKNKNFFSEVIYSIRDFFKTNEE